MFVSQSESKHRYLLFLFILFQDLKTSSEHPSQESRSRSVFLQLSWLYEGAGSAVVLWTRAMPPVRTLLFLVPLVKALRPSTTPAKQLNTASNMKARVASQKAGDGKETGVVIPTPFKADSASLNFIKKTCSGGPEPRG